MSGFDAIAAQYYNAGLKYSAAIQPYALKLFIALLLIDILVTWIQFTAEGQLDASHFLGRLIKHILSGGFVYLMIVNAFSWMNAVLKSFSSIGAAITGLPALSPQTVLQIGGQISTTIFNAPANASLMTDIELAIVQSCVGIRCPSLICHHGSNAASDSDRILFGGGWWGNSPRFRREPFHRPCSRGIFRLCPSCRSQTPFLLSRARHRSADGEPMGRGTVSCLQTCYHDASVVDHLRVASQRDLHNRLLGESACISNAQLRRGCHRLYGREYCRSLYRSRNRRGHNRPRPEPCF